MNEINPKEAFNRLIESVQLVAADYDSQMRSLPQGVHKPDEIALIFADNLLFLNLLLEAGLINKAQNIQLTKIDESLEEMEKHAKLWTVESVQSASEWQKVRELAVDFLTMIQEPQRLPQLYWLDFVL